MSTHDNGASDKCSYDGCNYRAQHIWRNGEDAYCNLHYYWFIEAGKRAEELIKEHRRGAR